jgi:SAM-dependent methyltransferase
LDRNPADRRGPVGGCICPGIGWAGIYRRRNNAGRSVTKRKPIALDAYEALADGYASLVDRKAENAYCERPAMLALLPPVAGKRVLDAGCGPGSYAEWLVKHGADVVGIDVSPKMIRLAKKRLGKSVDLYLADLEKPLDFLESGTFDIVFCPLVLDYIEGWGPVFDEFNRLLKGFGLLVFSTGHPLTSYEAHLETSYFDTSFVEDPWTGFGTAVSVPSYRRPLSSMLNPLIGAGFMIERVLEPEPDEQMRLTAPETYERLGGLPGFVCVRARKATASRPVKNGHLLRSAQRSPLRRT